ncbi:MAG TPA: choice-of-anchor Q domain-containing protein [Rudaea sp.]|nr:choice-of-anchor Q domain-containing protein [Rudaea sp.]
MKRIALCWAALLLCAESPFALAANTWTVTSTGSGGNCTANSSAAGCTLDAAINAAGDGDLIHFSAAVQGQTISGVYLRNDFGSLTIDGSPGGMILDGGGNGPFLALNSGNITLSHMTFQHATANAIYNTGATMTIDSCAFLNNSTSSPSDANGGAVVQVAGSVFIVNSTFVGNSASGNGGAINAYGNVVISNSTITANHAGSNGGGIGGYGFTIMSSIVAGNTAANNPDIYGFGGQASLGYNIIGNSSGSGLAATTGDQFGIDPLFVAAGLANNGGATQTVALQSSSPARSGGNCAGNASGPTIPAITLDQIDHTRTSAGAIGCTVGAFDMTSIFHDGFGN